MEVESTDDNGFSQRKKKISWSPTLTEFDSSKRLSTPSAFSVLVGEEDDEEREQEDSPIDEVDQERASQGSNGDSPRDNNAMSPTKSKAKKKRNSSSKPSSPKRIEINISSASLILPWEGWVIFIMCVLLVIFSISDFGLGDLYRGNGAINRLLINRGFFLDFSTEAESKQAAKDLLKKYVQVDSKIFQRPIDLSSAGEDSILNDGISDSSANNGLLILEILTPKENAVVDRDHAVLSVEASGAALFALDPDIYQVLDSGGVKRDVGGNRALPTERTMRIKARLDGNELSFLSGNTYKVGLQNTVSIKFDLLEHGLLKPQAGTGVHLLELELILDAFPHFVQGLLSVKQANANSNSNSNSDERAASLGKVSASTSVAFLFLGDADDVHDSNRETSAGGMSVPSLPSLGDSHDYSHSKQGSRVRVDNDGNLVTAIDEDHQSSSSGGDSGGGGGGGSGVMKAHVVRLVHPLMDASRDLVTLHPSSTDAAVELFIEMSPAGLLPPSPPQAQAQTHSSLWSSSLLSSTVRVIFSLSHSQHVDITEVAREQMQARIEKAEEKGGQVEGDDDEQMMMMIVQVPVTLRGVLSQGLHHTSVSLVDLAETQSRQLDATRGSTSGGDGSGSLTASETLSQGNVLSRSSLAVEIVYQAAG